MRGSGAISRSVVRVLYSGAGIALDPALLGVHFHRWPQGSPLSEAPTYGYGTVRSHDYGPGSPGVSWNDIHTADGVYNWASLDPWVAQHAGKRLIYTLYGTPQYLASSMTQDTYGNPGGGSNPTNYGALEAFITALINRYPAGTFYAIETWNEPNFSQTPGYGFWWGTAGQMVDVGIHVGNGIAASNDPAVRQFSPGFVENEFTSPSTRLAPWLAAESPTQAGVYGRSLFDRAGNALAIHLYQNGYDRLWTLRTERSLANVKAMMAGYGLSAVPIHVTECGVDDSTPVNTAIWSAMSDEQRGLWLVRHVIVQAVLGVQSVCLYSHDDALSGDFRTPAIAAALNRLYTEVAGKTLTLAQVRSCGTFELVLGGQTVWI